MYSTFPTTKMDRAPSEPMKSDAPVRETEIRRRISELDHRASMAASTVCELVDRLGIVSRPPQPTTAGVQKTAADVVHTDLGNYLMQIEERLASIQVQAEDALSRLEV